MYFFLHSYFHDTLGKADINLLKNGRFVRGLREHWRQIIDLFHAFYMDA